MNIGKIENVKEGMIFKNYKHLCEVLEVEIRSGKSKVYHLENLSLHFLLEKQGHKIIIKEIYETPLTKNTKLGRKPIYGEYVSALIKNLIFEHKGRLTITKTKLVESLGIVNSNYKKGFYNKFTLANELGISMDYINEFYNLSNSNLYNTVESTLNNLEKQGLISLSQVTLVKIRESGVIREATELDLKSIDYVDRMCMEKFNLPNKKALVNALRTPTYASLRNYRSLTFKENSYLEFSYSSYYIESLIENIEFFKLKPSLKYDYVIKLNSLYADNMINNAISRNSNCEDTSSIRSSPFYHSLYKLLVSNLISLEADELEFNGISSNNDFYDFGS